MRVFIDFDYTLCNTARLKKEILAIPGVYDLHQVLFSQAYDAVVARGHYSLRRHLIEYGCTIAQRAHIEEDFFAQGSRWLYADAVDFIERNAHHELIVLSYGDPEFQQHKITASGIEGLVSRVVCVEESKLAAVAQIVSPQEVFMVIDDRAMHLDAIAEAYPLVCSVRVTRAESPYLSEIAQSAVFLTHDLSFDVDEVQ